MDVAARDRRRRRRAARAGLLAAAALLAAPAVAGSLGSSGLRAPESDAAESSVEAARDASADPLVPFRLHLGADVADILERFPAANRKTLGTLDERYVHLRLRPRMSDDGAPLEPLLASPAGTSVVESDLYFDEAGELIEASLVLSMESDTRQVLHALESWLGRPDFEVVLPGGLDVLVGWRAERGYMIGSFSDIPLFQLSAFRHEPDDTLAGSHLLLYEGLSDYSERLAAGDSPAQLLRELLEIVGWVEKARRMLRPGE